MIVNSEEKIQAEIMRTEALERKLFDVWCLRENKEEEEHFFVSRDEIQPILPFAYEVYQMTNHFSPKELKSFQEIGVYVDHNILAGYRIPQVGNVVYDYLQNRGRRFDTDDIRAVSLVGRLVLDMKRILPENHYQRIMATAIPFAFGRGDQR